MFVAGQRVTAAQMNTEFAVGTWTAGRKVRLSALGEDYIVGAPIRAAELNTLASGGGPGPSGTPANMGEALWIGTAPGMNHFNIGIGQPGGGTNHTDTDMDEIEAGFDDSPWFTLTTDGDSNAQFRMNVEYGRTSLGTQYARSELRELTPAGANAAWDSNDGQHFCEAVSRVMRVAPTGDKPEVCFFQTHDASSDLMRVITTDGGGGADGLRLEVKWTPPGSSDEQSQIIMPTYELGQWVSWRQEFDDGIGRIILDEEIVWQEHGMGTPGCYFKTGCYNQANTDESRGGCDPGDYFDVEIMKGTLVCWHTGYAAPTTPVFTG